MSCASSHVSQSLDVKNALWLGTFYFNYAPHNISNMDIDTNCKNEPVKLPYVNILLEFLFERISEIQFKITSRRIPSGYTTPTGYTLRFHCTINVVDGPKVFDMESSKFIVSERFWLNPFYRQQLSLNDLDKHLELKILVAMLEYDCSSTRMCFNQEEEFRKIKEQYFNNELELDDMCYILRIPKVQDIFTGRQNHEFFEIKNNYIRRTAHYSIEIADYLRTKNSIIKGELQWAPVLEIDLGLILNYILNEENGSISDEDLIRIYCQAHHVGLKYLVDLSRDCIMTRIGNESFKFDALKAADLACDKPLFKKLAEKFINCGKELNISEEKMEELKNLSIQHRFMIHSLERRLKKERLKEVYSDCKCSFSFK